MSGWQPDAPDHPMNVPTDDFQTIGNPRSGAARSESESDVRTGGLPRTMPGPADLCRPGSDEYHVHVWPEFGAIAIGSHGPWGADYPGYELWHVQPPNLIARVFGDTWEQRVDTLVDVMRELIYDRFIVGSSTEDEIVQAVVTRKRPSRPNPSNRE